MGNYTDPTKKKLTISARIRGIKSNMYTTVPREAEGKERQSKVVIKKLFVWIHERKNERVFKENYLFRYIYKSEWKGKKKNETIPFYCFVLFSFNIEKIVSYCFCSILKRSGGK